MENQLRKQAIICLIAACLLCGALVVLNIYISLPDIVSATLAFALGIFIGVIIEHEIMRNRCREEIDKLIKQHKKELVEAEDRVRDYEGRRPPPQ